MSASQLPLSFPAHRNRQLFSDHYLTAICRSAPIGSSSLPMAQLRWAHSGSAQALKRLAGQRRRNRDRAALFPLGTGVPKVVSMPMGAR